MIFHPPILALVLASALTCVLIVWASVFAVRLLRHWELSSGSEAQLQLERQTYLVSTLLAFVMTVELASLVLFVFNADRMAVMFVGAMCAVGTLNASTYGFPALLAKIAVFFAAGLWLAVNHADGKGRDYPLIRLKYKALLGVAPLVLVAGIRVFRVPVTVEPARVLCDQGRNRHTRPDPCHWALALDGRARWRRGDRRDVDAVFRRPCGDSADDHDVFPALPHRAGPETRHERPNRSRVQERALDAVLPQLCASRPDRLDAGDGNPGPPGVDLPLGIGGQGRPIGLRAGGNPSGVVLLLHVSDAKVHSFEGLFHQRRASRNPGVWTGRVALGFGPLPGQAGRA